MHGSSWLIGHVAGTAGPLGFDNATKPYAIHVGNDDRGQLVAGFKRGSNALALNHWLDDAVAWVAWDDEAEGGEACFSLSCSCSAPSPANRAATHPVVAGGGTRGSNG